MRRLIALCAAALLIGVLSALWWLNSPISQAQDPVDLVIEPGTAPPQVASQAVRAGLQTDARALALMFRLSGQSRQIKAGSYEIPAGTTPLALLDKLVRGEERQHTVTLVEGWTFRQVRAALAQAEGLRLRGAGLSDEQLMATLGRPGLHPEGRFFPDTYTYARGSSDLAVLRQAMQAMDQRLSATWAQRAPALPLKSPDELLILASIVEKETGRAEDRERIAAVFANRLRIGMLLQTDPTVIYGLGERFDGNLRKRDLQTDTPYNTYTRAGLPPTPIAMPGQAALSAAARPPSTQDLYFVARGDGSSEFSTNLQAHNRAVNRFIRGQK